MTASSDESWVDTTAGALISLLPGGALLARPIEEATREVRRELRRRNSIAMGAAVTSSGLGSAEDLAEAVASRPDLVPLVTRVLHAIGVAGDDAIVASLGAAFGRGVADADVVDDVATVVAALQDLTKLQLRVLNGVRNQVRQYPEYFRVDEIQASADLSDQHVRAGIAGLVAKGLLESSFGLPGQASWRVTFLGHEVLKVIRTFNAQDRRE